MKKNKRIPLEGGHEYDALTKGRKYHSFGSGVYFVRLNDSTIRGFAR